MSADYVEIERRILAHYGEKLMDDLHRTPPAYRTLAAHYGGKLRDFQAQAANDVYKAFYVRQMFDLRYGHMFPKHKPVPTLRDSASAIALAAAMPR